MRLGEALPVVFFSSAVDFILPVNCRRSTTAVRAASGTDAPACAHAPRAGRSPARHRRRVSEHHGRTKHVARRHFFVRDQVKEGEISVRLVKTDDNAADFFSKPLKPSSFFSLRDSIMNIQRE